MRRTLTLARLGLSLNLVLGLYHIALGVLNDSVWFFTAGVYYAILGVLRFSVLRTRRKDPFAARLCGGMLMLLALPLAGTVILCTLRDRGVAMHKILMIALAAFAFAKLTVATVNLIRSRQSTDGRLSALRNVSFADACVSIFTLQRSMLVSFRGMAQAEIRIMNAAVGAAVCLAVFLLGLHLIQRDSH